MKIVCFLSHYNGLGRTTTERDFKYRNYSPFTALYSEIKRQVLNDCDQPDLLARSLRYRYFDLKYDLRFYSVLRRIPVSFLIAPGRRDCLDFEADTSACLSYTS